MKALLIRVGADQTKAGGRWNSLCDPDTNEYVYLPIPEIKQQKGGCITTYSDFLPALEQFSASRGLDLYTNLRFPKNLMDARTHLDPDFYYLTYGDVGARRGSKMKDMEKGDLIVFYSSLRPIKKWKYNLCYAIIGLFVVDEVISAYDVEQSRWSENAHTRRMAPGDSDIVIRAEQHGSGRLEHCILIGEWRQRAYRVRQELLDAWGGLLVKNGYIQRSANPPNFLDPQRFYDWFKAQHPVFLKGNF